MAYAKRCIVTGAAGFVGSALARLILKETEATVQWYLDNEWWWPFHRGRYSGERLGTGK